MYVLTENCDECTRGRCTLKLVDTICEVFESWSMNGPGMHRPDSEKSNVNPAIGAVKVRMH